ncbi:MAG: hypothetical protein M3R62_05280 [Acidobacteriota bacterium]|nr:hypothetical protein [Acidobacteriota bacterium]
MASSKRRKAGGGSGKAKRRDSVPPSVSRGDVGESFPVPDRFARGGKCVGDICFECECRILETGGPDGLLLAWCECAWPDEHHDMEIA